ncbi:MAG: LCP family protein, partial [Hydrococcus sp. Prado102]|nr:LCP family protein [Hydrococcus sp. Prado102]
MSAKNNDRPTTGTQNKKTSGKKFRASWLLIGLGLTGVAMLSATAGAILAVSLSSTPLKQTNLSQTEEAVFNQEETISYKSLNLPQLSRPVNILVLGTKVLTSDLEEEERPKEDLGYHALVNSFKGLSDTMLLLRFDPQKETVTVLSIPRDTQAEIEGHGIRKVNEANYYGGPALAAESISKLLGGVPIDRYVRVNIQGVEKLIDALGGVTVYVPKDMKYQDDSQHLYINLKEGEQHLDGNKAIQFLRFRYDEFGDISRVQR